MSLQELTELVRQVTHGRGDAIDKFAELLHNLQKPAPAPKAPAKKAAAKKVAK